MQVEQAKTVCRACDRPFDSPMGWFSHATQAHPGTPEADRAREWLSENNPNKDGMTDEHRRKLSDAHRGKTIPPEQREKISESLMGHDVPQAVMDRMNSDDNPAYSQAFRDAVSGDNNPAKRPEVRRKISENNPMKDPEVAERQHASIRGGRWPEEAREARRGEGNPMYGVTGEDHHNWRGGPTHETAHNSRKWQEVREQVLDRDDRTCQWCGAETNRVHHWRPVRMFKDPEDAHTMDNAVTLCYKCHGVAHRGIVTNLPVEVL